MSIAQFYHELFFQNRLTILMYHGVLKSPLELEDWCFIDEHSFRSQMKYLKKYFDVIHLSDALEKLRSGNIRRPAAVVTFDDGFQNNYGAAFPILLQERIPATIFLSTGLINTSDTVWFCRLNLALSQTSARSIIWEGNYFDLSTREMKTRALASIKAGLKRMPHPQLAYALRRIIIELRQNPDLPIDTGSPFRMLDRAAINEMNASGIVRFGAHTHNHAILSLLTREQQKKEIKLSVDSVYDLTGIPCRCFSYPNGQTQDYDRHSIRILSDCGVQTAVTTISAPNTAQTPSMELRRYGMSAHLPIVKFHMHHLHSALSGLAG